MIENFVPDIYQKSIYYINYDKLFKKGIRCILFDLDNTMVPSHVNTPTKRLKKLFNEFKIPIHIRNNVKILFDKKGKEIVWIESIGVSKNYVVSSETNKIGLIVEKWF